MGTPFLAQRLFVPLIHFCAGEIDETVFSKDVRFRLVRHRLLDPAELDPSGVNTKSEGSLAVGILPMGETL